MQVGGAAATPEAELVGERAARVQPVARRIRFLRRIGWIVEGGTATAVLAILGLLAAFLIAFGSEALPTVQKFGLSFLTGVTWAPNKEVFGALPALVGTLLTSAVAMLFAVPISLGFGIFLSEYAPGRLREALTYLVDLGAAIPSIVYGYWGFLVLLPIMRSTVEPALQSATGGWGPFSGFASGLDVLTASVVLACMIVPTMTSLTREALRSVPRAAREPALSLGATRWEATRLTVLRPATPGIIAAGILALGRALGETVAVVLTIGGIYGIPTSFLSGGVTLASWIASELPGALPPEQSALVTLGLILLATTFLVNGVARYLLARMNRPAGPGAAPARRFFSRHRGLAARHLAARGSSPATLDVEGHPARASGNATRLRRRRWVNYLVIGITAACGTIALLPLASVLHQAIARGGRAVIQPSFWTGTTAPPCLPIAGTVCHLGGIGPAIEGTLLLLAMSSAIAIPLGFASGLYLAEFGRGRITRSISFVIEVMAGIPSILIGIFVFILFVTYDHNYSTSAYSAAIALGLVMVPIVTRSTEEALRAVPASVRESALALGFPRSRVAVRVVTGCARGGLVSGSLLAVARAAGETAAVLFTAGAGSTYLVNSGSLNGQIGTLPTLIYTLGQTGYSNWQESAWGAALILLLIMLGISLTVRLGLRRPLGAAETV